MALKTYTGSCHCGKVRFEADVDLMAGTGRCNCSFCAKVRNWSAIVKPSAFRLLTSEAELGDYQFRPESPNHHYFCKSCGVRMFSKGYVEEIGGDYRSVVISVLEGVSPEELAALPMRYFDGKDNNWFHEPKITSYL
ncbi:GFA family protein [Bdellovibrio sp. HCB2-146]|uniref:GFA family protein n=1 Tax=Bdellovibrio sp. HCB2-146 TaxID=3394362 RepID=UPI0039BC8A68